MLVTEAGFQTRGFDSIPKKRENSRTITWKICMYVCDVVDMDSCESEAKLCHVSKSAICYTPMRDTR